MKQKRVKRIGFGWLVLSMSLVLAVYLIASNQINKQTKVLVQQESSQRLALSRLETEQTALKHEIELAGTDAYIENLARTQYGYLKEGEIRFEITNPEVLFMGGEEAQISVVEE